MNTFLETVGDLGQDMRQFLVKLVYVWSAQTILKDLLCQICPVCFGCKDQNDETRTVQVEVFDPCNPFPCPQRVCVTCKETLR